MGAAELASWFVLRDMSDHVGRLFLAARSVMGAIFGGPFRPQSARD